MFRDLHVKKIQVVFVPSNNENQQLSGGEYKGARKRWSLKLRGLINLIGNVSRATWRIILVSKWLITLVGKSSNWDFFCLKISCQSIAT